MAPAPRKKCPTCRKNLTFEHFNSNRSSYDGMNRQCRGCYNGARRRKRIVATTTKYRSPKQMPWEYREQTADAFERFFNKVSGLILPKHAKDWVAAALENKALLLQVPPRHAKTTLMAIWFSIWQFSCNRDMQVIIVSKTADGTRKIRAGISNALEYNLELIQLAGTFRPTDHTRPWRKGLGELELEGKDLSLRSDLSLQIRGTGQQILGMEADLVVADDVTDQATAKSETQTRDEWDWFTGEVLTRLSPTGRVFCIGQRVHENDLYGRLAKGEDGKTAWKQILTPAINERGEALWPEEWPIEALNETRGRIGASKFECMYQQSPSTAGDYVKGYWIYGDPADAEDPGCLDYDRKIGDGWKGNRIVPITRVLSVDPSPTSYAAIVVADIVYQHQAEEFWCAVVDIRREKMGQRGMIENIQQMAMAYHPSAIIFESNSVKHLHEDPVWNTITRLFDYTIDHKTGSNKNDGLMGVWSLAADFETGRIRLPYGDDRAAETSDLLIREVLAYPYGRTDDVLMALWFIKANYQALVPADSTSGGFDGSLFDRAWNTKRIQLEGAWAS